ncbi:nuclear transport factor 2 family protein [Stigmatella aurantiaca]|uniref:nuclear transport factor 2 family protein n=1 Tax=Stigmatella aurantiaca TaxID=41 RepID=UPI00055AFA0C|nr:nuclear transport factor 2 family protein [Stigmatella aurantiaca]
MTTPTGLTDVALERLREAIDSHDPQRVADCFTSDYRSEVPLHPDRSFVGNDHVLRNWTAMFARVPDITARILRSATGDDGTIWSEWEMSGTGPGGAAAAFAGPVIVTVRDGRIDWARFYLDAVES